MKWIVGYEKPPMRGIKFIEFTVPTIALLHMADCLKDGYRVRSIDWDDGDQKTSDQCADNCASWDHSSDCDCGYVEG